MNLPWGSEVSSKFITNVGLITSDGPHGPNIMSAEWTHHISYSPGLIAVCINPDHATCENIKQTKEFGVSLCPVDKAVMASVSGGYTGRETDKIEALRKLGFEFYKGKKIKTLMVKGSEANIECRVIKEIPLGDHVMFVGEALEASSSENQPLAYHKGRYWMLNTNTAKPSEDERARIRKTVEGFER